MVVMRCSENCSVLLIPKRNPSDSYYPRAASLKMTHSLFFDFTEVFEMNLLLNKNLNWFFERICLLYATHSTQVRQINKKQ